MKNTLATHEFVQELRNKIDEFASIDHINKLRTLFLPKFKDFGTRIDFFFSEMTRFEQIIKQFDFNLNLKANKAQIMVFEDKINNKFISQTKWHDI